MPVEGTQELAEKIAPVEQELAQRKGEITLFALFLREDAPNKWDLIIAAPWAGERDTENLKDVSEIVRRHLSSDDLLKLSRIVLTKSSNDHVRSINQTFYVGHGDRAKEVRDTDFFGMPIKHAWIMTSTGVHKPRT